MSGPTFANKITLLAAVLVIALLAASTYASPLDLSTEVPAAILAGEQGQLRLVLALESPWYIYAPTGVNAAQDMVETDVVMRRHERIQFADALFPEALPYGGFAIFDGDEIVITQPFRVRPRTEPGEYRIRGGVDYQACDGEICLPSDRAEFTVTLSVE